jgi:hypothetical protein
MRSDTFFFSRSGSSTGAFGGATWVGVLGGGASAAWAVPIRPTVNGTAERGASPWADAALEPGRYCVLIHPVSAGRKVRVPLAPIGTTGIRARAGWGWGWRSQSLRETARANGSGRIDRSRKSP